MHLLIEALGIRSFGGATVLLDLLQAIDRDGRVEAITLVGAPPSRRSFCLPHSMGITEESHALADRFGLVRGAFYLFGFPRAARRSGADVVLSLSGMAGVRDIPTAVLIQNPMPFYPEAAASFSTVRRLRFRAIRTLMRRASRRADVVIVQSAEMRRTVSRAFGRRPGEFAVFTPGVSVGVGFRVNGAVADLMGAVAADRRLLYVGSTVPSKNLGLLVEGIRLIRSEMPGATLFATVPTDHPMAGTDGVVALGVLDRDGVATAYQQATALCFASLGETVGLPLLEAMAAGVAVLAADRPYAREMCGDAASYFDPHDTAAFASEACRLLGDGDLAARRRAAGREITSALRGRRPYEGIVHLLLGLTGASPANQQDDQ